VATFTKLKLSGSTDGRGIEVGATAIASGTTIHTASSTALDEVWLYASNPTANAKLLTIGFGGTDAPDDLIELSIPGDSGLVLVVPGLVLTNSLVVKASAVDAPGEITIFGYVNRIS
jgi:hypothetical protein